MERAGTLIERLKEQHETGGRASEMMITAQMLLQELYIMSAAEGGNQQKVSVIVPKMNVPPKKETVVEPPPKEEIQKQVVSEPVLAKEKIYSSYEKYLPGDKATVNTNTIKPEPIVKPAITEQKEINEVIANTEESLNDKLKTSSSEKEHILYETPIKDLRAAIGINDRFRFIQELFRGDESVYERSIITINSFNQYSEAEYWIQRELKVKSGWDDNSEVVQQFNQLVRRRFS